ncbi:MAG: hypothetical protein JWN04_3566 [Myxococcaceae bacterium]|nr:hypothetical protein [Myxococcaceae bacterium]
MRYALYLYMACLGCAACVPEVVHVPATAIVLQLDADSAVRESMTGLRVRTTRHDRGEWVERGTHNYAASELSWPVNIVLTPQEAGDDVSDFQVVVEASNDDASLVQARAISQFVPREGHVLALTLAACGGRPLGVLCAAAKCDGDACFTCAVDHSGCVPTPTYDARALPGVDTIEAAEAGRSGSATRPGQAVAQDGGRTTQTTSRDAASSSVTRADDAGALPGEDPASTGLPPQQASDALADAGIVGVPPAAAPDAGMSKPHVDAGASSSVTDAGSGFPAFDPDASGGSGTPVNVGDASVSTSCPSHFVCSDIEAFIGIPISYCSGNGVTPPSCTTTQDCMGMGFRNASCGASPLGGMACLQVCR